MARADRHFCKVAYAALCTLMEDNERKLGRDFVRNILRDFDPNGNSESEDNAFTFADRVLQELERRRLDRNYDDRDLMDAVTIVAQRMVDRASSRSRDRDRGRYDDRDRDRDRDRGRRDSGFGEPRSRGDRDSYRDRDRDRDTSLHDDRTPVRRERDRERSDVIENTKVEPAPVSNNVNPLAIMDDAKPSDMVKVTLPEAWCEPLKNRGFILKTETHDLRFASGTHVRVYTAKSKETCNSSFEHLKRFFSVFPSAMTEAFPEADVTDLWTVLLNTQRYHQLNISLKEYNEIKTALMESPEEVRFSPKNFCRVIDEFPRRVWKIVSNDFVARFNTLSESYLRTENSLYDTLKISNLDDLEELMLASTTFSIKSDPEWKNTFHRVVKSILTKMFFSEVCNIASSDNLAKVQPDWSHYIACDAIAFDPNLKMTSKLDVLRVDNDTAASIIDDINSRMVFWSEPVTLIVTNILSEKTINKIPMNVGGVDAPDFNALRGIFVGLSFLRAQADPVEVYTTLFKESPSTFLRQFNLVVPMAISSKFTTISGMQQKVLGM